ncbi:MAG TPA: sugar transferase [Nocardioidaceae bacterium]|nr:sugar transferase [Nocardioidaceae bacterium]
MGRVKGDFRVYRLGVVLADIAVILAVVTLAYAAAVDHPNVMPTRGLSTPFVTEYTVISVGIVAIWLLALLLSSSYSHRVLGSGADEYKAVLRAVFGTAGTVAVLAYLTKSDLSRLFFVLMFTAGPVLAVVGRYSARQLLHHLRRAGWFQHDVVVVGGYHQVAELIEVLDRERWTGYRVVGVCLPSRDEHRTVQGIPVVGDTQEVREALQVTRAEAVFLTSGAGHSSKEFRRISWQIEGTGADLAVLPSLTDVSGPRIHVRPLAGLPLLHLELPEFTGPQRVTKRLLDVLAATFGLVLLAPLLLLISLAIKVSSPGPVLFKQIRVGRDGKEFLCLKFRTMVVDAEARLAELMEQSDGNGLLFKMRDDPRVTRAGRKLRRFSLDELPQLLNILRGDMSVVGPRPPLPAEVATYSIDLRRRLLVRPGLTGLWQVSGRSELSLEESTRLDLYYVDNWSLMSDVEIAWKTVRAVLGGRGAY